MRSWFLGQGIPMYVETVLFVAGLFTLWMTGRIYKRLIREADLMGTSNHRLIKYIKLKVTSYYKVGMRPEDTEALIGRYIKKFRVGPFSLQGWSRLPYLIMTTMLAVGGGNLLYRWTGGAPLYQMSLIFGLSLMGTAVLGGVLLFMDFTGREELLIDCISDYVDNYLSNKLYQDYKGQTGTVSPDQYKRALQEVAAAGTGRRKERERNRPYYYDGYGGGDAHGRDDEVDAKIVEDVLKEFLC
ncbi:MAG: hypothetical protein EOM34_03000 [Clostridia bacterium]|nr:hypothetical protein [Lachnospiraceae bacterium]NCB99630.1 hypothetical protein [Clostridia bacterium]NCD01834.1 hypothetical protein [Clostridia bacterium]